MEIQYKKFEYIDKDYFKIDYENQDVTNLPEFKKWYEQANKLCKTKNLESKNELFTIGLCKTCSGYTICSIGLSYCFIQCIKCQTEFCIACNKKRCKEKLYHCEGSICLKGYLKVLYLRIINRRTGIPETRPLFFILHIFFCLLITPLFLGFISFILGYRVHPKEKKESNDNLFVENGFRSHQRFVNVFSFLRGLLMFPYIILFFPFMFILLLPGIFSFSYYLYIYNMYVTSLIPGPDILWDVGNY